MYLCGPRKHNCQPFCAPEGRFDCSDSVSAFLAARAVLWSMLASEDFECAENCLLLYSKTWLLPPPAVVSFLTDSAACVLSFYRSTTPLLIYKHKTRPHKTYVFTSPDAWHAAYTVLHTSLSLSDIDRDIDREMKHKTLAHKTYVFTAPDAWHAYTVVHTVIIQFERKRETGERERHTQRHRERGELEENFIL